MKLAMTHGAGWIAAAGVALLLPGLLGAGAPVHGALVLIAIFAVMSYGLDLVVSDLGEVSLAHTVFFAGGCYTTALLSIRLGAGGWTTLVASIVTCMVLAGLIGAITLRLRAFAFSLVTYAVAIVAFTLAANWEFLGGSDGIRGLPMLDLSIPGLRLTPRDDRELWPYALALLAAAMYLTHRFRRSRLGVAALMAHLNSRLAVMSGVDLARTRLLVFMLSAPITGAAGWLYAYQRSYVSADVLENYFLILMLTAVILCGRRQLLGPVLTVAAILVQEKFFSFGGYLDKLMLGTMLVTVLAVRPEGLFGLLRRWKPGSSPRAAAD